MTVPRPTRRSCFTISQAVRVAIHALRLPRSYDTQAHAAAEASKDYQRLISKVSLKASRQGPWMSIEVPALSP